MSGERTEKATPKKKQDERKKGNVLKSADLSVAIQVVGLVLLFGAASERAGERMQRMISRQLNGWHVRSSEYLSLDRTMLVYRETLTGFLEIIAPFFAFSCLAALTAHAVQTRFLVTAAALAIKPDRLNPISGFKRIFSSRSVADLVRACAKIIVLVAAVQPVIRDQAPALVQLMRQDLASACRNLFSLIHGLAVRCAFVLTGLAVFDLLYQWWRFEKDLRMTKQEVKDEMKQIEGNPQTRGRIRQIQRAMAARRMMQDVPQASVVITNPTHIAVALRYRPGIDTAPIVLAKGQDLIAQRIKEIARENRIALIENRPLARSLHAAAEIGRPIPADLYGAVAEVLAAIARIKEGKRS